MRNTRLISAMLALAVLALVAADAHAFYDPKHGRFLQRDPGPGVDSPTRVGLVSRAENMAFVPRDPVNTNGFNQQYADGLNLHQYVRSNPARYVDWTGAQTSQPDTQPSTQPDNNPTNPDDLDFPNSPAGGPSKNPNAVVCRASYSSLQITCSLKNSSASCPIVGNRTPADQKNGRTPSGEYLIDIQRTHSGHNIEWYNLLPKLEDNSGYYGYGAKTKDGRTTMGLHPGCVTQGCVTVFSGGHIPAHSDPCWKRLSAIISKGDLTYKSKRSPNRTQKFHGFLWVD